MPKNRLSRTTPIFQKIPPHTLAHNTTVEHMSTDIQKSNIAGEQVSNRSLCVEWRCLEIVFLALLNTTEKTRFNIDVSLWWCMPRISHATRRHRCTYLNNTLSNLLRPQQWWQPRFYTAATFVNWKGFLAAVVLTLSTNLCGLSSSLRHPAASDIQRLRECS